VLAQHVKFARRKRFFPLLFGFIYREGFVFHNVSLLQASGFGTQVRTLRASAESQCRERAGKARKK
jgi:hypothetical protein